MTPDPTLIEQVVSLIRARAKQHPSEGLMGRQALDESHVKYGQAVLSALADEIGRTSPCGEDLGPCELCDRPLALGQFVNQYDDIGTAHANCEAPFAKPLEETPAPGDDGSAMPTYVLLGVPALLDSISEPTLQGSAALPSEAITLNCGDHVCHHSGCECGEPIYTAMRATTPTAPDQDTGASVPDQALAVPVEPVARLDPSGFDPSRWQPVETCTLEDEPVLTIRAGTKIPWVASQDEDGWTSFNMIYETHMAKYEPGRKFAPTHWMPLPPAPAIATEAGTATTTKIGVVHEGAGPEDIAHD